MGAPGDTVPLPAAHRTALALGVALGLTVGVAINLALSDSGTCGRCGVSFGFGLTTTAEAAEADAAGEAAAGEAAAGEAAAGCSRSGG